jgi:hypothetical protein
MTQLEASVPCPHCHTKFPVPLQDMAPGKSKTCPHCGTIMRFAGQDASKVQQVMDQLGDKLTNASIKVTIKTKQRRPWWKFWGA